VDAETMRQSVIRSASNLGAFVLNKLSTGQDFYYEAVTVLPVEWAYMNARLIVRPDEEWARIIEEVDSVVEEDING
jgi:hypothetical protein